MASDAEVLREMLAEATERARASADLLAQYPDNKGAITGAAELTQARVDALSIAISALEAREAQPKVEGRMEDADFNAIDRRGFNGQALMVDDEAKRARASEAALSKRVEELGERVTYLENNERDIKYAVQMAFRSHRLDGTHDTAPAERLYSLMQAMGWEVLT